MKGESLQGGNAARLGGRRVGTPEILRPAAVPEATTTFKITPDQDDIQPCHTSRIRYMAFKKYKDDAGLQIRIRVRSTICNICMKKSLLYQNSSVF